MTERSARPLPAVLALVLAATAAAAQGAPPADPALGMGLAGVADWSTEQPFLDLMRSARPWIAHRPGQWGGWEHEDLVAGGYLTPEGWPRAMPEGAERMEALVLMEQPEASAPALAGTYVLRWSGDADLAVGGRAANVRIGDRRIEFDYTPGEGYVGVAVTRVNPEDPVRGVTLVRADREALLDGGAVFNPDLLDRVAQFRSLRFLDWMAANGSPQVAWADRPEVGDATWAGRGVPVEILVRLANEAGADPWFTLPHQADDAYVTAFATYVRDHLDPRLKAYAEWSNEVWNWGFPQAGWADAQAKARWGEDAGGDAWMQFAGLRAAEVADLWAGVYGPAAEDRLVRVVGTQTAWLGLEAPLLEAPLAVAEGRPPPVESFDAYAVTGYFAAETPDGQWIPDGTGGPLAGWIADGTAGERMMALARDRVRDLVDRVWPYQAAVAQAHGLRLVAYEGGTHIVGLGEAVNDDSFTDLMTGLNYAPGMGALYDELLAGWREVGGTLFVHYHDISGPSRWGSWGALRHLADSTPRWDALVRANAVAPDWEPGRDPAAFAPGRVEEGTPGPDRLEGTPEEDDLLGGPGDDVLVARGADRLTGGEGRDEAVLPGAAADWTRGAEGARATFTRGWVTVRMTGVEAVRFAGDGSRVDLAAAN